MNRISKNVNVWRKRTKIRAIEFLGGKCKKCGYDRSYNALCFHHKNPKRKVASISSMLANGWCWKRIQNEVKKCILVCANCHAELHDKNYSE